MTREMLLGLTGKHLLELAGILKSTNLLQLGDHTTLTIIRRGSSID